MTCFTDILYLNSIPVTFYLAGIWNVYQTNLSFALHHLLSCFLQQTPAVAIVNGPGTASGKGVLVIMHWPVYILPCKTEGRHEKWDEYWNVLPCSFRNRCSSRSLPVVPNKVGQAQCFFFTWRQYKCFVTMSRTHLQRCDIIYFSYWKAPFSVFNNNSWNLIYSCEKKLSSLVYRFPQICCIYASTTSTKFQLPPKKNSRYWMKAKAFRFPGKKKSCGILFFLSD